MKATLQKHDKKIRFGAVGAINTLIDFGILVGLSSLGINKYVANFASTSAAFVFSFFVNRSVVFKSKGSMKRQAVPFLVVTLSGLWVLQPVVIWAVDYISPLSNATLTLVLGKCVATLFSLVWNYVLYSKCVFK